VVRSVTRVSHASGNVKFGTLPEVERHTQFKYDAAPLEIYEGPAERPPIAVTCVLKAIAAGEHEGLDKRSYGRVQCLP